MRTIVLTFFDENEKIFLRQGVVEALDSFFGKEPSAKILFLRFPKVSLQFITHVQKHIMAHYPQRQILSECIFIAANSPKEVFEALQTNLKKNTAYTVIFQSEPEMIKACWLLIATSGIHPLQIFQSWQKGNQISMRTVCFPGLLPRNELFDGVYETEENNEMECPQDVAKRVSQIIDWLQNYDF